MLSQLISQFICQYCITVDGTLVKMPPDFIGAYSPESRKARIDRFHEKRTRRVWTKKVKYDVRKNFADSRLRVKVRYYFNKYLLYLCSILVVVCVYICMLFLSVRLFVFSLIVFNSLYCIRNYASHQCPMYHMPLTCFCFTNSFASL